MPWSIASNAAERSNKTRMTSLLFSVALRISLCTLKRAVSVLWDCWKVETLDRDYLTPNNDGLDKQHFFQ